MCRTARLLDLPLILRPEDSVYHLLRRYADMGPSGFMIPWTEREEQLETVKSAIFVPPRGRRGPGGPSVMRTRSLDLRGWQEVEDDFFVCFQVETPRGIEALPGLADRDWIDAVMLGPYDLSLNLGHCGEWDHPVVVDAILQGSGGSAKLPGSLAAWWWERWSRAASGSTGDFTSCRSERPPAWSGPRPRPSSRPSGNEPAQGAVPKPPSAENREIVCCPANSCVRNGSSRGFEPVGAPLVGALFGPTPDDQANRGDVVRGS